jgi:predicted metal-dependent peptidase
MSPNSPLDRAQRARYAVHGALRMVSALAPHLAGLAAIITVEIDTRVSTAGIFASGRLVVNPEWFVKLSAPDAAFVAAHELMHLALRSHDRTSGSEPRLFNIAHDYIINHMLSEEMGMKVPAGGLVWPLSSVPPAAEKIVEWLRQNPEMQPRSAYDSPGPSTSLGDALTRSGLLSPRSQETHDDWDVLSEERERALYPDLTAAEQRRRQANVVEQAARTAGLERLIQSVASPASGASAVSDELVRALRTAYGPPWEVALQRWLEAVAPGPRSWQRASRRGSDRQDVVLPGRRREGWTLHIILDTSGSMAETLPRVLGAIAAYCDQTNIETVHLLQCDADVTADDWVTPNQLEAYRISGYGGSDLSPAFHRLAKDPEVEAVVAITDGAIIFPDDPPPYAVLWVLTEPSDFAPQYGQILLMT